MNWTCDGSWINILHLCSELLMLLETLLLELRL